MKNKKSIISFDLEVTARCNNNCRHCYINLPPSDSEARARELSLYEITRIAGEATSMGAMWCTITGGEPLLRDDFFDLYLSLKRQGLLLSILTNATLVTKQHARLFKKYPPRDIEVSVYGITQKTYEGVTRQPGSFAAFRRGLDLLLESSVKVRLKAMALRSNVHELADLARFCRAYTKDYFRFDPLLHLRFDGNAERNEEIRYERLSPEEIVATERADEERFAALAKDRNKLIRLEFGHIGCNHLFHCGVGDGSFTVSYDGLLRLCSALWHPDCLYDLRKGTLMEAWQNLVTAVHEMRSCNQDFLRTCRICPLINLCLWCPAHSHLESGEMDSWVKYFCQVAHARANALGYNKGLKLPQLVDAQGVTPSVTLNK